ncbi:MAG TPA: hypothetical protein DCW55_03245 [Candidatus Pacebacteria bacterium]|nr:MAG: NAD-dependent epimerase/dehydratase [Microgenomates group bacterium GW2011_GWF1_44_10]OGJ41649.1 MAG: hypothetical protein A2378_02065 [Candidatus Pacebacteria bacterium RIFOXYB1_FULL_44_10]HAU99221.1 hypothetical protein [Candidatus Paceibacterota bacterium]HAX01752.1 hypothetical protein [Candidatus Paceibacterota bacterium]
MTILVTGSAGFIGYHLVKRLLSIGHKVVGIDSISDYYDISLKEARNNDNLKSSDYSFVKIDICDQIEMNKVFSNTQFNLVIHLAAQAGVRHSLTHPYEYIHSNLLGMTVLLECMKQHSVPKLIFASSSSVYGNNPLPIDGFSESDLVDNQVSLYGATKKSDELIAHVYHHLYNISCIGLRFFTVYGPYGRPDMAYFSFTQRILRQEPIVLYNFGNMERDFTYIDDIIDGIMLSILHESSFSIFNIGHSEPVNLQYFVSILEKELGMNAKTILQPMQKEDLYQTYANISKAERELGYHPKWSIEKGLHEFVAWYQSYYHE